MHASSHHTYSHPAAASSSHAATQSPPSNAPTRPLTLLAIGDWGGRSDEVPASKAQRLMARAVGHAAEAHHAAAVLLLGDNFYPHGVASVDSPRFAETFEEVFASDALARLPFHVCAGNHDHEGSVHAQMAYSSRSRGGRWRFPAPYYNVSLGGGVEVVLIDTVTLAGDLSAEARAAGCWTCLAGPADERAAEAQWEWIRRTLAASRAEHLLVAGHYPIYSAGDDGTTGVLVERLLPLLAAHGAHYVSGHDHMLQHIESGGVHMFVSGVGMECCYNATNRHTVPEGAMRFMITDHGGQGVERVGPPLRRPVHAGFSSFIFTSAGMQVRHHAEDGEPIYAAPPLPARARIASVPMAERAAHALPRPAIDSNLMWEQAALLLVIGGLCYTVVCKLFGSAPRKSPACASRSELWPLTRERWLRLSRVSE